ncbi:MAG TPA: non-canonical purine NTP pyrophosphatase [Myxococcota bacterium]|nr:non-canonical purine NTP pyrophosphatase [Myxococcota bacterium]HQK49883.1 non-canonical purine NTP pyrophosphatase [Myxococcota bacterium]
MSTLIPLVLATFNPGKVREYQALFQHLPVRLMGLRSLGIETLPPETGDTFVENARLKAQAVFDATGLPALGDDSGLEVRALGGAPGVHSARFAGPAQDARANLDLLLRRMEGIDDRRARFVCALVGVFPAGWLPADLSRELGHPHLEVLEDRDRRAWMVTALGTVEGILLQEPRGEGGFGYDPIFYREDLGGTFGEAPEDVKNRLSHRGQAASRMALVLARLMPPGDVAP